MLPGVSFGEFLIICVVALVVIGPRDLPKLARKLSGYVRQARGLAKDFQRSFDEMGRQLELDELRREVDQLRRGEPLREVTNEIRGIERDLHAVDGDLSRRPSLPPPTGGFPSTPRPTPTLVSTQAPAIPASAVQPAAEPASQATEAGEPSSTQLAGEAPPEDRKIGGS